MTKDLFGLDKTEKSIELLREMEPKEGYFVAFSGGKDSQVIYHLTKEANVKADYHYSITTCDPPDVVKFMREHYKDVIMDRPKETMWELIPKKLFPPTRRVRYCCAYLKEDKGFDRTVITGVRAEESPKRKNRQVIQSCYAKGRTLINPILWWTEEDVWGYLNSRGIPHCKLYDEGWKRIGCVGCPIATKEARIMELDSNPHIKKAFLHSFKRMLVERERRGKTHKWKTPEDVYEWWINYGSQYDDDKNVSLFS